MIFDNNSTALGTMDIPMAEGYDFQTGTARALIESARNDYAMFKAMLSVDSRECRIQQESAGYVTEGEIVSLTEATIGGIWQKIKDLFAKLVAKIKSIFSNFIARITGLVAKDKTLVKKYRKQILAKGSAISNMEVKFAKVLQDPIAIAQKYTKDIVPSCDGVLKFYHEEKEDMVNAIYKDLASIDVDNNSDFATEVHDICFDEATTDKLSEFGESGPSLVNWMDNYTSKKKGIDKAFNQITSALNKLVKDADKNVSLKAKAVDSEKPETTTDVDDANHTYQAAVAYQECVQWAMKCILNEIAIDYKQHKAAFMKAVTVNEKKLKESAVYAEAVAEAAAQEVEDVLTGAISKEELSDFNAASKNILDGDASDDPYANEYDKCSYYSTSPDYKVDGSIDSCINSRCGCKESYDFGAPLY